MKELTSITSSHDRCALQQLSLKVNIKQMTLNYCNVRYCDLVLFYRSPITSSGWYSSTGFVLQIPNHFVWLIFFYWFCFADPQSLHLVDILLLVLFHRSPITSSGWYSSTGFVLQIPNHLIWLIFFYWFCFTDPQSLHLVDILLLVLFCRSPIT